MKLNTSFFLILPAVIYVLAFAFYPTAEAIYLSFKDPHGGFTLFYYKELFSTFDATGAIINTVIVTIGALALQFIIGLIVALILTREFFGRRTLLTIVLIPMGIATVVAAVTFKFIFETSGGYANSILHSLFGISVNWYQNSLMSLLTVIISDSWKNTPIITLILLSGMMSIPEELYHAAAIDGAGPVRRFFYITLPNLRKFIGISLILRGVQEFNIFALPLILIGYHPPLLTTLIYNLYQTTFPEVGLALAGATVLIAFILVFVGIILILSGR